MTSQHEEASIMGLDDDISSSSSSSVAIAPVVNQEEKKAEDKKPSTEDEAKLKVNLEAIRQDTTVLKLIPGDLAEGEDAITVPRMLTEQLSKLVGSALEPNPEETEVPLLGVKKNVLKVIEAYLALRKKSGTDLPIIPKPLRSKNLEELVAESDKETIQWLKNVDDTSPTGRLLLYQVIMGANYMDIQGLIHAGCAFIASLIKGEPLDKIPGEYSYCGLQ